jgi:3'(2'), 5'-bisphosphate nucleotidase
MLDLNHPEIRFAIHAVQLASCLARKIQTELVSPALTKEDRSPVTVADFACQALIGSLLEQDFPDDPLVAEEDSAPLKESNASETLALVTCYVTDSIIKMEHSGANPESRQIQPVTAERICEWIDRGRSKSASRFWVLDPIDGTKGFLRGDQYAIAFALVNAGKVRVAVLGCPNLVDGQEPDLNGPGSLVIAACGQGTWTTSLESPGELKALHVSECANTAEARLMRSFESGHTNADQIDLFLKALGTQATPVLMDSQAKYSVLAAGGADILLRLLSASKPNYREKIWDQAAGALILEEAGGKITDLDGKDLDFTAGRSLIYNRGILASNGMLHTSALTALKKIGA